MNETKSLRDKRGKKAGAVVEMETYHPGYRSLMEHKKRQLRRQGYAVKTGTRVVKFDGVDITLLVLVAREKVTK